MNGKEITAEYCRHGKMYASTNDCLMLVVSIALHTIEIERHKNTKKNIVRTYDACI